MVTTTPAAQSTYAGTKAFRHYTVVGVLLLLFLAVSLVVAWVIVQDNAIQREETLLTSLAFAVLAFGLVYILLTLPKSLRLLRDENLALHQTETTPTVVTPQPTIESRPVEIIEGIGATFARRLEGIGVRTLRDLRRSDEEKIQQATGANAPTVNQWKAMANLLALDGVDAQAAELLVRTGIDTVAKLGDQEPVALHRRLIAFNRSFERRVVPDSLRLENVRRWVTSAKSGSFRATVGVGRPTRRAMA